MHNIPLALNKPTTFSIIFEMQHYVSAITYAQPSMLSTAWSKDMPRVTIGSHTLSLGAMPAGIAKFSADTTNQFIALVGEDSLVPLLEYSITDDIHNNTLGYSFLSKEPFASHKQNCFHHLVKRHNLAAVDGTGALS